MSSYNQVPELSNVGQAIHAAQDELVLLSAGMAELCASIAAQFPDTYEGIPKYKQALYAHHTLEAGAEEMATLDYLTSECLDSEIRIVIGKQTRQHRRTSQRVRLGNAVVRLCGAADGLCGHNKGDHVDCAEAAALIQRVVENAQTVTFPTAYG